MTPTITLIDTTRLKPNPNNPRKNIGDITALADSIRAHGIQQELVVTPIADSTDYRVVIGHRRLAASQQAGLAQVPCRIMELSPKDERELMVIENTQRHDLTPIEEADAYQGLLDLGSSIENMAEKTGRSTDFAAASKSRESHASPEPSPRTSTNCHYPTWTCSPNSKETKPPSRNSHARPEPTTGTGRYAKPARNAREPRG